MNALCSGRRDASFASVGAASVVGGTRAAAMTLFSSASARKAPPEAQKALATALFHEAGNRKSGSGDASFASVGATSVARDRKSGSDEAFSQGTESEKRQR
jgi:hypothetical protein